MKVLIFVFALSSVVAFAALPTQKKKAFSDPQPSPSASASICSIPVPMNKAVQPRIKMLQNLAGCK